MRTLSRLFSGKIMEINRDCSIVGMPMGAHFRVLSEQGMGFVLAEKLSGYMALDAGWEEMHQRTGQLPRYVVMKAILSPLHE